MFGLGLELDIYFEIFVFFSFFMLWKLKTSILILELKKVIFCDVILSLQFIVCIPTYADCHSLT